MSRAEARTWALPDTVRVTKKSSTSVASGTTDEKGAADKNKTTTNRNLAGQIKAGQTLGQTNVQTPLLPLSGTRKVVRTPTNPFEAAGTVDITHPELCE